jgi:hypothetical protein
MKKPTLLPMSKQPTTTPVLITIVLLFAACCLPQGSATPEIPDIQLPEQAITMIATDGVASYFDIHLNNVPQEGDITNADYPGWCADRAVTMPRGQILTIRLHNSYDPNLPWHLKDKDWAKANDILNHHQGTSTSDVQDALWYLLCETNYSLLSDAAKTLVDNANPTFIPQEGDDIAIIAEPIQNTSQPWPFQISFLQIPLPREYPSDPDDPDEPDEPITPTTRISHGYRYNDIAPTAITNGPYTGYTNEPIAYTAIQSYDTDGIIITYHWNLGDGTTAETITTTHAYPHAGTYKISLTVTDNFGLTNTQTVDATITNRNTAPTNLKILGPTEGTTNSNYSFAFQAHDSDNDLITFQINWGDSTTQTKIYPSDEHFAIQHHWNAPGAYTITVTAQDKSQQTITTHDIIIKDLPITENIWIIGLALLAIILLLALWFYSRKAKNTQ